jgi:hypothetical protein
MNVTITGASGFIGRRLMKTLLEGKHSVHVLSRHAGTNLPPGVRLSVWNATGDGPPEEALQEADAIVHLAGEPIAQRWTPEVKERIRASRVDGTRRLVEALSTVSRRPAVLVCGSATGIYGSRGDEILTESSAPGSDFLAAICKEWEKQAELAESLGMRVVTVRTGIVLGTGGGALARMLPPFRRFVGGKLGSGRQWMSWIHLDDLVGLIRFVLENPLSGPVNGTAPNPVTNADFTRSLAAALRRPAIFPVPGLALKLLFGEMAQVLLGSQRVLPRAAQAAGFRFHYPELSRALKQLLA